MVSQFSLIMYNKRLKNLTTLLMFVSLSMSRVHIPLYLYDMYNIKITKNTNISILYEGDRNLSILTATTTTKEHCGK